MSLYEKCTQLSTIVIGDNGIDETMLQTGASDDGISTRPQSLPSMQGYKREWMSKRVYYISDIHLEHRIVNKFKRRATDDQIERYIKRIAQELITKEIREIISCGNNPIVLFGGDIASNFELAKIFYSEFVEQWNKCYRQSDQYRHIYAIIGNHEFWTFETIDDCYMAYREMFKSLNICFLENHMTYFGRYRLPMRQIQSSDGNNSRYVKLTKEDDAIEYERQMRYIHNVLIVGGTGFAGYNQEFNANMGIYRHTLTRDQEIIESSKWENIYERAREYAKSTNSVLIVLTHNPIRDWKNNGAEDSGCVYFSGHNHKNYLYHDEDRNIHIFANNQIGYHKQTVQLKEAYIYERNNPFAAYSDGYHEITTADYLKFYDYMNEHITGNGLVEHQLKTQDAHFYMIKHKGYYGFFLVSPKGAYICAGGRIKKISECNEIERFDADFLHMIKTYMGALSPYRYAQEQISESIKSFGGEGTIHGCIIDIDFFNHVMLNPSDGSITYYSSPMFGAVQIYSSLMALLDNHNKTLADQCRKQLKSPENMLLPEAQIKRVGEIVKIDIKNSVYAISNRINQLQRLFDKKILRDWNENLLDTNTNEVLSLPAKK